MTDPPTVGVVVVNYLRDDLTMRCLRSLAETAWTPESLDVVVVDNGSSGDLRAAIRREGLRARVVGSGTNVGFPAACNLGIHALPDAAAIALMNNDATPERNWLEPLVEALIPGVGAATPLVLLDGWYATIRLAVPGAARPPGDNRVLGVQVSGVRRDGIDVLDDAHLAKGFWGWEDDPVTVGRRFAWTMDHATLQVPSAPGPATFEIRLSHALGPTSIELLAGGERAIVDVGREPRWVQLAGTPDIARLVNNAGTVLLDDCSVADRGFLSPAGAPFDLEAEVFGWSATAVLLPRAFLEDVGEFDERYFLYYEDADLAWRGRVRGWTYRFVPASVVWHEHSATVGSASALGHHLAARNRLVTITRNAPARVVRRELGRAVATASAAVRRDVLRPVLRGRRPRWHHAEQQLRVLAGAAVMLPGTVNRRARDGRQGGRARDVVERWTEQPDPDTMDSPEWGPAR